MATTTISEADHREDQHPHLLPGVGDAEKAQQIDPEPRGDEVPPGGTRETREHAERDHHHDAGGDRRALRVVEQHALQGIDGGRDEEGREDVGVLEQRLGAAIARQDVISAGDQMQIAKRAGHRGEHRRQDVGVDDQPHPLLRGVGDIVGNPEAGEQQEDRHHLELQRVGDGGELRLERSDDRERDEHRPEDQQPKRRAAEGEGAREQRDADHEKKDELVGRGLGDDHAAEEDPERHDPVEQRRLKPAA